MVVKAARLVVSTRFATATLLRRRLHLNHHQADMVLERLEQYQVIGPHEGTAARRVLITSQQLPLVIAQLTSAT